MIEVSVTFKGGTEELAHIRIENMCNSADAEYGTYSVEFGVDTAEGFAIYQRSITNFPRKKFNVLGLLRLALDTLDEKELSLDGDPDAPRTYADSRARAANLARRLRRSLS